MECHMGRIVVGTDGSRSACAAVTWAARVAAPGVDVRCEAIEGGSTQVLLEQSADAAMLVVGARGHGGFIGLVLGSVSDQCARHAHIPVVVVPAPPGEKKKSAPVG